MKKIVLYLLGIVFLVSCKGEQAQVDKAIENGVEVVLNHLEPYKLPGVPSTIMLEDVMTIDTEKEEIAKLGLTSIEAFCLDRDGDIFFMLRQSSENFIYKFDPAGRFLKSFGRKGQGPGEFDWGGEMLVDEENHVIAKDMTQEKLFTFAADGTLLKDVRLAKNLTIINYLGNKRYLVIFQDPDPDRPVYVNRFCICDDTLAPTGPFYTSEVEDSRRATRYRPSVTHVAASATDRAVMLGDSSKGYEIGIYDFTGKLLRKFKKEYRPVPYASNYRALLTKVLGRFGGGQELLRKLDMPAHWPPFRFIFTDGQGRIFVMTYEREGERRYWYDIFTNEGVFIGRVQLDNVQVGFVDGQHYNDQPLEVIVRGDRLYCLREKDSGYIMLTVYRMKWK